MSDRLLLRLHPDGGLTWLREGAARVATGSGVPARPIIDAADEIVVLVPAEHVVLTETRLSARSRTQLLQALPYAVEDQLLQPVDELHVAASRGDAGAIGVAVIARQRLAGWLERLAEAGIRPDALIPESLALPLHPGQTAIFIEDACAVVRSGPWSAFACGLDELPEWLSLLASSEAPVALVVHDFRAAPRLPLPVPVATYHERQRDPLAWLAAAAWAPPLNLLDGEFAARHRHARGRRWWRIAAVLAAVAVGLAFVDLAANVIRLSRTSARMDTLAREAVRNAFPDIDAAQFERLGPEPLMRSRMDSLRGGTESGGLLRMLARIGPVLATTRGVQTRGMEFRNGTLELALRAPDVGALDRVRERLAASPGLSAEVTAANPGADGVDGRIRVAMSGSGGTP